MACTKKLFVNSGAIKAMVLNEKGEYLKAYDLANSAVHSSEANGYTGVTSALDAKFGLAITASFRICAAPPVMSRCPLCLYRSGITHARCQRPTHF